MEKEKMKACPNPKCGSSHLVISLHINTAQYLMQYVKCQECGTSGPYGRPLSEAVTLWNALLRPQWVKWHMFFGCVHPAGCEYCSWCMFGFSEDKQMQGDPPEKQPRAITHGV